MNYILLDFEWDTVFYKNEKRFVNKIIQIGAVKLDKNFKFVEKFECLIFSDITKKVSKRCTALTGITTEDMLSGITFEEAVKKYNEWVGNDFLTLTWSNSDLYAIIENSNLFLPKGIKMNICKYADLQSYVQSELKRQGKEINNQISLSTAAEMLGISVDGFDLHTAIDDSKITAEILKTTYSKERIIPFILDAENPKFYNKLTFKNYYLSNLDSKLIKKQHMEFCCAKCGKKVKPMNKWKYRNHWFSNDFNCKRCGNSFIGRIKFKVTYSGLKVNKKMLIPQVKKNDSEVQSVPETV